MIDVQGLDKAYARDNGILIRNTTMLVSGAKDFPRDHWDDVKLPFNLIAESFRYRNADKALKDNPQITSLVGHSLGGSVSLEMQKNYPDTNFKPNTYGAPVKSITTPEILRMTDLEILAIRLACLTEDQQPLSSRLY